jgi:uncharacterized protein (DUF433 family)
MNEKPNPMQLALMRALVVSDPEIMRGTPVFKGTRIPVDLVADMLAQGATAEEILEGYPTLNEEMISLAPLYARVLGPQRYANRLPLEAMKAGEKSFPLETLLKG